MGTRVRLVRREYARRRTDDGQLSQVEMARLIGLSPPSYKAWENGTSVPRNLVSVVKRLALVTGVDPNWVLGLDGPNVGTEGFEPSLEAFSAPRFRVLERVA